jgi:23S rRNA (uracil1939-C5)-methyltransferase
MVQKEVTLSIEQIITGGAGMAHYEGKTIFVDLVAPEDVIRACITNDHGHYSQAKIQEILVPSPQRIIPFCPVYGQCGGCNLQQITYKAQLLAKKQILIDTFSRIGGIKSFPDIVITPSSPSEYRNRVQFHRILVKNQNDSVPMVGFKCRTSNEVLPLSDCPVADPGIRNALRYTGIVPAANYNRFTVYSKDTTFLQEGVTNRGTIQLLNKTLTIDATCFFQSNAIVLEKLITDLLEFATSLDTTKPVADLYCGVGTFATFLNDIFPQLDLMEENTIALSLATHNVSGKNIRYFALKDEKWATMALNDLANFSYELIVMDPPRQGLSPALCDYLIESKSPALAYISCDPATLARDTKILCAGGYTIEQLRLYDFYPHTAHIESLVFFKRT